MVRKVLLIEDDPDIRQIYRMLLQHSGWAVVEATTAQKGVDMATGHQPELIILDLGLPGQSGMTVIQELRAGTEAPILVVSGDEDAEPEARRLGATEYILKPFDPFDELLPMIEKVAGAG
jgi:two-component system, OmpR family, KDP operon response regulator KdpE